MIGWYAHHHGLGHLTRARCVIPHLADDVTLFCSHPAPDVQRLPLDVEPPRSAACAAAADPVGLHYAPLGVDGVRHRMAAMTAWVEAADPDLVVVDVSVEVAALMRLLSVPTVVVRQHGLRDDAAHLMCYGNASLLLAPYPEWLEEAWVPGWMRDKTTYTGGFSRFDDHLADDTDPSRTRATAREVLGVDADTPLAVVLNGTGGIRGWPVDAAAAATPRWRWVVLGATRREGPAAPGDPSDHGPARGEADADRAPVTSAGWIDEPLAWLQAADVVVTHAGHNAVMEAAAARRPTIVVPQDRPFDEQGHKARLLQDAGVVTVADTWPAPDRWGALLDRAADLGTEGMARLVDGEGALRATQAVQKVARKYGRQVQLA